MSNIMDNNSIGLVKNLARQSMHTIRLGNDGVRYCDCWAWKKNRTCKHLTAFEQCLKGEPWDRSYDVTLGTVTLETRDKYYAPKNPLEDIINQEIERLKR